MNKRELVKWLENKKTEAIDTANVQKATTINRAKELEYSKIKLDEFIDSVVPLYQQILDKYEDYIHTVSQVEGVTLCKYYYRFGYNDLTRHFTDKKQFKDIMNDTIRIETKNFSEIKHEALQVVHDVTSTYDTVLQTVKNLPTYKDGLEYLKKLGFDISEIQPAEKKKQLPATISVNVNTRYLLLKEKESSNDTQRIS